MKKNPKSTRKLIQIPHSSFWTLFQGILDVQLETYNKILVQFNNRIKIYVC
jgi:hypothetical protein